MAFASRGHRAGDPWALCDRCRFRWRLSQLTMQNGLLLCPNDYDNETQLLRNSIIRDVLISSTEEAANLTQQVRQNPGIVEDQG